MSIEATAKKALQLEHILKCVDHRQLDLIEIPKEELNNHYLELEQAGFLEIIRGKTGWIAPLKCTPEGRQAYKESKLLRERKLSGAA